MITLYKLRYTAPVCVLDTHISTYIKMHSKVLTDLIYSMVIDS